MDYNKKISEIVEDALIEKTFSLEIITKIKALKDDFDTLVKKDEVSNKRIIELETENKSIRSINEKLLAENSEYNVREQDIAKKEKDLDKNKYELEFHKMRANEIKELFGIVFKNPVTRESVIKNSQLPIQNNGYTSTMPVSDTENKEIELE